MNHWILSILEVVPLLDPLESDAVVTDPPELLGPLAPGYPLQPELLDLAVGAQVRCHRSTLSPVIAASASEYDHCDQSVLSFPQFVLWLFESELLELPATEITPFRGW